MNPGDCDLLMLKIEGLARVSAMDPDREVVRYDISVYYEDEAERVTTVGTFEVWRFQVDAYCDAPAGRLLDLFECHSSEALSLYEWLFDPDAEDYREGLGEGPAMGRDLLYFHEASCKKDFAASPHMLAAVQRIIQLLGSGCALAVIWPWDVRYPDMEKLTSEQLDAYWAQHKQAEALWRPLGFKRLAKTPILIRDMALKSPTIPEILGE